MVGGYLAGDIALASHHSSLDETHALHHPCVGLLLLPQHDARQLLNLFVFLLDLFVQGPPL